MYPPSFTLSRPATMADLLAKRAELGDLGAVYAGGTELILAMKMGMLSYDELIDIKRIPELGNITHVDHTLKIGGSATHRAIQHNPVVQRAIPEFSTLISQVGNLRVRASGTLAGNLAFAEPHADPPAFLVALGATVELARSGGTRMLDLTDFIHGAYQTDLQDTEIISSINVPLPEPNVRVKYARFRVGERPMVTVAIAAPVEDGRFSDSPEIVLGAVDEAPRRIVTDDLTGVDHTDRETLETVAGRVHDAISPTSDTSGSVDYKHHIAEVVTRRALTSLLASPK